MPTISDVIDGRRISGLQWRVLLFCGLIVLLDGYDLATLALALPSLSQDWDAPPASFGWALTASTLGLGLGAIIVAPLGDRFGRRPVLIGGLLAIALSSFATAGTSSLTGLALWRIVTGIGLGACQSNATALAAEYAPVRARAAVVTLLGCNVALGGMLGAFFAPFLIDAGGWPALFLLGGALPLATAMLVALLLPDSVRLLWGRRPNQPGLAAVIARLAPELPVEAVRPDPPAPGRAGSITSLLGPSLLRWTLALWLLYTGTTFLTYLVTSWLPTLLAAAGWSRDDALRGLMAMQGGGVAGALLLGVLVARGRTTVALMTAYVTSALAATVFALVPADGPVWTVLLVALGIGLSGSPFVLVAVAAALYPPALRATGIGWMAAVARGGAVAGPLAAAWALGIGVAPRTIMALLAVPALLCLLLASRFRHIAD